MIARRETMAHFQSDFYRYQYYRLLRWFMVLLVVMVLLIVANLYVIFTEPVRPYYANTIDGKIFLMPPAQS